MTVVCLAVVVVAGVVAGVVGAGVVAGDAVDVTVISASGSQIFSETDCAGDEGTIDSDMLDI